MAHTSQHDIVEAVTGLLKELIAIPSFSKEEDRTAEKIFGFLEAQGCSVYREGNNVWVRNKHYDASKPTLLLNSHHDTVKPNTGYTRNPFEPVVENGKLYGLGSNDAGGPLVSLLGTFLHFNTQTHLPVNIIYAATAEEEISGKGGIESIVSELSEIDLAIVGEPTGMQMAVAERGLLVLDCIATGKAGHAARSEGINAIYEALPDIEWFRNYKFDKTSEWLGPVSMNVTVIEAGHAHNQIPAECKFMVDIRLNECYTHEEILATIKQHVKCTIEPRSTRIKPSFINTSHPMIEAARNMGIALYGSPTTSDMALMPWNAVKIGPGLSERSHSADEFIFVDEIKTGIEIYIALIENYAQLLKTQSA
ncbi:MAG TPA: M20 family metallo-hydrolase [Chitinophagales bacterium]|nr:M20 family metallo-hydrolase [Chitinophagales bacterium]